MLNINKEHIEKFKKIKDRFLTKTNIPKENNWRSLGNNEIWQHILNQVIVVGGSVAADRLNENKELKNKVSYGNLEILTKEQIEQNINEMLRIVKARYASSDIMKCKKTKALVYNLEILRNFKDGPKCLLSRLSEFQDNKVKIEYLMRTLSYIKSKGARDFLMELGLEKNAIALDTRVTNILRYAGINIPENFGRNYDEIEEDILENICKPLELSGIQFDRMLYQNYEEIMKMKF